jgi:hypothetical protein
MTWLTALLQEGRDTFRLEEGQGSPSEPARPSVDGAPGINGAIPEARGEPPVEGGAIEGVVPEGPGLAPLAPDEATIPWSEYSEVLLIILGALALLVLILLIYRLTRRPKRIALSDRSDLYIDVTDFSPDRIDYKAYPRLEWMGSPAHLTLIVVAFQGTGGGDLQDAPVRALLERALPGLGPILDAHQTEIRLWDPQVSRRGFEQLFFHVVPLPGDHGRGTPWCSVVSRAEYKDRPLLLGMVLYSPQTPNVTQMSYEHESKLWSDLRFVSAPDQGGR